MTRLIQQSGFPTSDASGSPEHGRGFLGGFFAPFRLFRMLFRQATISLCSIPYKYESPQRILGFPLLSVNIGFDNPGGKMRRARGIFAIGNQATGFIAMGLFSARGVVAIAPVAAGLGVVSVAGVALVSVSIVGLGIVSVSVFAVGIVAIGIISFGIYSVGIAAVGRYAVGIIGIGDVVRGLFRP